MLGGKRREDGLSITTGSTCKLNWPERNLRRLRQRDVHNKRPPEGGTKRRSDCINGSVTAQFPDGSPTPCRQPSPKAVASSKSEPEQQSCVCIHTDPTDGVHRCSKSRSALRLQPQLYKPGVVYRPPIKPLGTCTTNSATMLTAALIITRASARETTMSQH